MTKKLTKKQLGEGNYISPEIKTVEFKAEGPLCTSIMMLYDRADAGYNNFYDLGEI